MGASSSKAEPAPSPPAPPSRASSNNSTNGWGQAANEFMAGRPAPAQARRLKATVPPANHIPGAPPGGWGSLRPGAIYEGSIGNRREAVNYSATQSPPPPPPPPPQKLLNARKIFTNLGEPITANSKQKNITDAFRRLSLVYHPDKGGNQEIFKNISAAHNVLKEYMVGGRRKTRRMRRFRK